MNKPDTQVNTLFTKAKTVSLSTPEKENIHESLVTFMESNPINEATKAATAQPSPLVMNPGSARLYKASGGTPFALFGKQKKTHMIIALFVVFGLTAGTSFAAQNTLPGDVLYPIKIHLNEEVESIVAVGAKADAQVKAKHALKRLEEAGKLNAAGRLTVERKSDVEHRFREHVKEMDEDLRELRTQGDTETEIRVRGEFNKKAERHRKDLLVVHTDGTRNAERSIDLSSLLDVDEEDTEQDDRNERRSGKTSSTTLRDRNDEEEHREFELRQEDRERGDREEREVEIHVDVEDSSSLPQLRSGSSREVRSSVDLKLSI